MSTSTRWLLGVGIAIAAAIVFAVVVALTVGDEQSFADGTPERTVQRYLEAVAERDASAALDFISPAVSDECGTIPRDAITSRRDARFRATLYETVPRDGRVDVHVTITESFGDAPFNGGESTWPLVLELTQEDGVWRFTQLPWPLYCTPKTERAPIVPAR